MSKEYRIASRVNSITPSLTRKLFNMAKSYDDVVDLTLGDPDLEPPASLMTAACEAITHGNTRYSANAGLIEVRKALADFTEREYGTKIDANKEIMVTVGGMEGLFLSLASLIEEGDEVIVPGPYYVNYVQMIRMFGGKPVIVYSDEEHGFMVEPDKLRAAVTPKTVAIVINSPCNPTGEILSKDVLDGIAKIAVEHDLMVISDEVYRSLIYDDIPYNSIINCEGMRERTVLVDSMSKRFSMTGYRLGYLIAPEELIASMVKLQENVVACAPLPSQYAALTAYSHEIDNSYIVNEFKKRRDFLWERINSIEGLSCRKPSGTFYLFVNISDTNMDSVDFAYKLLESVHVAVVPGETYGEEYKGYIRIAFTLDISKLEIAADRIKQFVESIRG